MSDQDRPRKVRRVDFHPDEYIVGASALTFEEQGVFWMICALVVSHGGPIDADYKRLGALGHVRPSKAERIVDRLIEMGKITKNGSKLVQKRAETQLKLAQNRIENASKNAQKRWSEPKENNHLEDATAYRPSIANHQPSTINHQPPNKKTRASRASAFDEFWSLYPRKVGKQAAIRKWDHVTKRTEPEVIIAGLKRLLPELTATERRYQPNPATWLNQGRWEDETGAVQPDSGAVNIDDVLKGVFAAARA